MKPKDIIALGIPEGEPVTMAVEAIKTASRDEEMKKGDIRQIVAKILKDPAGYRHDEIFGRLAEALIDHKQNMKTFVSRGAPAPYRQWGADLDEGSVRQMENACALPISVQGALMPDACWVRRTRCDPRFHGNPRLHRTRKRRAIVSFLGISRCWTQDESQGGNKTIQVGGRNALSRRTRYVAYLRWH